MTAIISLLVLVAVYLILHPRFQNALIITVGSMPLYLIRFSVGTLPTNLFETSIIVLAIIGLADQQFRKKWWLVSRAIPLSIKLSVVILLGACLLSILISTEPRVSLGILKSWVIIPLLLAWLIVVDVSTTKSSYQYVKALILSGVIVALISLTQIGQVPRLVGMYDVPNSLALYLAPLAGLAWWHGIITKQKIFYFSAIIITTALVGTLSVGGIAALGIGLVSSLILVRPPNWRPWMVLVIFGYALVWLVFANTGRVDYFIAPLNDPTSHSSWSVRWQLWSISIDAINDAPMLGSGLGQFEGVYQKLLHQRFEKFATGANHNQPIAEFVFRDPHNWLLAWWINTGLLGLLAFITLTSAAVIYASKQSVTTQSLVLALSIMLVHGLVDTIYWKNDLAALYWVLVALLVAARRGITQLNSDQSCSELYRRLKLR